MTDNKENTQVFYANGKLLLTAEYYVLEGAKALAVPTQKGQNLVISHGKKTKFPKLYWKSYNFREKIWLDVIFDIKTLEIEEFSDKETALKLQQLLRAAQLQNPTFLKDKNHTVKAETHLDFPRNWGLGSSSTLISNLAEWAKVDAFALLSASFGGSGYDLACAQNNAPICYQKLNQKIFIKKSYFNPAFKNQLYFLHLGKKQSSAKAIAYFYKQKAHWQPIIKQISQITTEIEDAPTLLDFEKLLNQHEQIIANNLQLPSAKSLYFEKYWGTVKSLGAWGGDFVLVTSDRPYEITKNYFLEQNFPTFLKYDEMVLS